MLNEWMCLYSHVYGYQSSSNRIKCKFEKEINISKYKNIRSALTLAPLGSAFIPINISTPLKATFNTEMAYKQIIFTTIWIH